jgi:hypothetical protein
MNLYTQYFNKPQLHKKYAYKQISIAVWHYSMADWPMGRQGRYRGPNPQSS